MHDIYVFGSLEVFETRLRQMFEPQRAEFRAQSELLKPKQGKRDEHAYAQYIQPLASCITAVPVHEHTLITVFMKGLADGPIKTHVFRLDWVRYKRRSQLRNKKAPAYRLMLVHFYIVRQDDKRSEVQKPWTFVM